MANNYIDADGVEYATVSAPSPFTPPAIEPADLRGFSIDQFKANALQSGILKNNLYLVNFSQKSRYSQDIVFFTDNVQLPAVDLDTMLIRRHGYGPIEFVPFRPIFSPITMSFMCSADSNQNSFLDVLNGISGVTNFTTYDTMSDQYTGGYPYEVEYKGNYEFGINVYVYNEAQQEVMSYNFRDCYAKQISGISLGWGNNDAYMKVDVTFLYTDFGVNVENINTSSLNSLSPLQTALGYATPFDTLRAIQSPQNVLDALNLL